MLRVIEYFAKSLNQGIPCDSLGTVSYSHSIVTIAISCIVSEKSEILVEMRFFHTPCIRTSEYCHTVWYEKQEVKVIGQKAPHGGPISRLGVTPGGRKLYH